MRLGATSGGRQLEQPLEQPSERLQRLVEAYGTTDLCSAVIEHVKTFPERSRLLGDEADLVEQVLAAIVSSDSVWSGVAEMSGKVPADDIERMEAVVASQISAGSGANARYAVGAVLRSVRYRLSGS